MALTTENGTALAETMQGLLTLIDDLRAAKRDIEGDIFSWRDNRAMQIGCELAAVEELLTAAADVWAGVGLNVYAIPEGRIAWAREALDRAKAWRDAPAE